MKLSLLILLILWLIIDSVDQKGFIYRRWQTGRCRSLSWKYFWLTCLMYDYFKITVNKQSPKSMQSCFYILSKVYASVIFAYYFNNYEYPCAQASFINLNKFYIKVYFKKKYNAPFITLRFSTTENKKMGFCIANDINNTQMITMKICAKGSKMFRIYKLCEIFPL